MLRPLMPSCFSTASAKPHKVMQHVVHSEPRLPKAGQALRQADTDRRCGQQPGPCPVTRRARLATVQERDSDRMRPRRSVRRCGGMRRTGPTWLSVVVWPLLIPPQTPHGTRTIGPAHSCHSATSVATVRAIPRACAAVRTPTGLARLWLEGRAAEQGTMIWSARPCACARVRPLLGRVLASHDGFEHERQLHSSSVPACASASQVLLRHDTTRRTTPCDSSAKGKFQGDDWPRVSPYRARRTEVYATVVPRRSGYRTRRRERAQPHSARATALVRQGARGK